MTKIPATNFTATGLQFVYSTDDADPFDRDEVNLPAQALDQHTHASTLGLPVMRLGSGVQAAGPMLLADGTAAAPSLAFQNAPTTGLFQSGGVLHITTGGTDRWQVNASGHLLATTDNTYDIGAPGANRPRNLYLGASGSLYWAAEQAVLSLYSLVTPNAFDIATGIINLKPNAAGYPISIQPTNGITEFVKGTIPQTLNIYSTFTNASNFERLAITFSAGAFRLLQESSGTGVGRHIALYAGANLYLGGGGTTQWLINAAGHLQGGADNTFDIGAGGTNRPRNVFVSGAVANRTKAGTPVDADVNTPTDGMLVVDTTASKIWVRVGGTWKGVAVA